MVFAVLLTISILKCDDERCEFICLANLVNSFSYQVPVSVTSLILIFGFSETLTVLLRVRSKESDSPNIYTNKNKQQMRNMPTAQHSLSNYSWKPNTSKKYYKC